MATTDEMKAAVDAYLAAHTAGDVDAICALFSDDAKAWDPVDSPPHEGAEGIRAFFTGTHEMMDRLELVRTGPVRCAGPYAAFPMTARSHLGDLHLEIDIIDVMTFDEAGKICEMKAYWDMADSRQVDA